MHTKAGRELFNYGVKSMLPVIPGIIPFGLIMGSVATASGLSTLDTMLMNTIVFAGASQLAAVDLMSQNVPVLIIIMAGLTINLRFILYSAANAETFNDRSPFIKLSAAYLLTDQSYAVVSAKNSELKTNEQKVSFYFGACLCMMFFWNSCVLLGCFFGNILPAEFSLEFAVPLSFMALTIPTLKTKGHFIVAITSAFLAVILFDLPLKLGLMAAALGAILIAILILRRAQ